MHISYKFYQKNFKPAFQKFPSYQQKFVLCIKSTLYAYKFSSTGQKRTKVRDYIPQ